MQFSKWVTLGFGALCLVAVAGVLNAQHLYYMAAILLTLPGVSYGLGWYTLRGLEFDRELPPTAWEGEEGDFIYSATNHTRVSRFFLTIQEPLPSWLAPLDAEPPLFNAASNDTVRILHRVQFRKRGVYRVEAFDVTAMDPLGVFAFTKQIPCAGELVVYPLPVQMRPLPYTGAERYGFQDFMTLAMHGSSVDPDGVRQYMPGDPLRRIHWRQTARTGKLSVIEFEETQSVNLAIVLDVKQGTEVGTGTETTLEYGVRLAASLAHRATQQGVSMRLLTGPLPGGDERASSLEAVKLPGRGQQHLFLVLDALARVEAESPTTVRGVVTESVGNLLPGTTLIIITSQADPQLPNALTRYTATGANVLVAYIDPETFENGRTRLSPNDVETFFTELLAIGANVFVVRRSEDGELNPEAITDAHIRQAQSRNA